MSESQMALQGAGGGRGAGGGSVSIGVFARSDDSNRSFVDRWFCGNVTFDLGKATCRQSFVHKSENKTKGIASSGTIVAAHRATLEDYARTRNNTLLIQSGVAL